MLEVTPPFLPKSIRGIFATHSSKRPNHIGLSLVELISIKNNILNIRGIDALNKTSLLDIKPFTGEYPLEYRNGWLSKSLSYLKGQRKK